MTNVFVSIGSNISREQYITNALCALEVAFGSLQLSSVYESEAVGFAGDNFYNLVVGFETDLSVGALTQRLKEIEADNGRVHGCAKFSARTLDIDILTFDQVVGNISGVELPRQEITENAFVLLPLSEIAASELHPVLKEAYSNLWSAYSKKQLLWPVDFVWKQTKISLCDKSKLKG